MTLAARDREFIAATANYFSEKIADEFVDSGFTGARKAHQIVSSVPHDVVVRNEAMAGAADRHTGLIIYTRVPYLASAMVAATMAFSPPAYASETRPRPNKAETLYAFTEAEQGVQLKEAVARVEHLAGKAEGWKGPGSIPMPQAIKAAAIDFLSGYYSTHDMADPFVGLDADGDVTLFWKNERLQMDLSISEDGRYSFYAETNKGTSFEADDVPVNTPLPDELAVLLQKHAA
ncbi:MAG: hypothetical protein ABGX47_23620 [Martelella sp.]|uniref:hypothetical protein n=1 Tax=Martelella sp. TaxID=1969699 RepID=UPI0032423E90